VKAKEWADRINKASSEEEAKKAIIEMFKEFLGDMKRLKEERKVTRTGAFHAILKELNQKWNAVCVRSPVINRNGFINLLRKEHPMETAQLERLYGKIGD
jgi:hypothetical protein